MSKNNIKPSCKPCKMAVAIEKASSNPRQVTSESPHISSDSEGFDVEKRHKSDTKEFLAVSILPGGTEKKKMPKKLFLKKPIIDHIPADLKEGSRWYIEYYVWNPNTKTDALERKHKRLDRYLKYFKTKTEKRRAALRIVAQLNEKLQLGWNPYIEGDLPKAYKPINEAFEDFINGYGYGKREDTVKSYKTHINQILKWLERENKLDRFIVSFTHFDAIQYIDYIYIERKNKLRTRKNHIDFFTTAFNWFVKHGYIDQNPFKKVDRLWSKKESRIRKPIDQDYWPIIFDYFQTNKPYFLIAINLLFQCLIRRTEMCKLKLSNINFENQTVFIPGTISKTGYDRYATVPDSLFNQLISLDYHKKNENHFILSENFAPGKESIKPKKISSAWSMMRDKLNLPKEFQFYSLRSTAAIYYLEQNLKPRSLMNQADWHSYDMIRVYDRHINDKAMDDVKQIGREFK